MGFIQIGMNFAQGTLSHDAGCSPAFPPFSFSLRGQLYLREDEPLTQADGVHERGMVRSPVISRVLSPMNELKLGPGQSIHGNCPVVACLAGQVQSVWRYRC